MSKKRRFRFDRWVSCRASLEEGKDMCYTKAAYPTLDLAKSIRDARAKKSKQPLRVYVCPICTMFHLTKEATNE